MTFELKATAGEENDLVINDCLCKAHINMTESKKSAGFKYARVSVFSNSKSVPCSLPRPDSAQKSHLLKPAS